MGEKFGGYRARTEEYFDSMVRLARERIAPVSICLFYDVSNITNFVEDIMDDGRVVEKPEYGDFATVDCFLRYLQVGELEKFFTFDALLKNGIFEERPYGPHTIEDCCISERTWMVIKAGIAYPVKKFRKAGIVAEVLNSPDKKIEENPDLILIEAELNRINPKEYTRYIQEILTTI